MVEVLLSSEAFIKSVSSVSDNLSRKYILPSLREAQEVGLKGIVGSSLLEKLKSLVKDGLIEQNAYATYKALLDKCQYVPKRAQHAYAAFVSYHVQHQT
jgi:hypothetical protein